MRQGILRILIVITILLSTVACGSGGADNGVSAIGQNNQEIDRPGGDKPLDR